MEELHRIYIMVYNTSYCGPKLLRYKERTSSVAPLGIIQIKHTALGWALGMQIKHSPQVQVASVLNNQAETVLDLPRVALSLP